jgi:hypothetical protein
MVRVTGKGRQMDMDHEIIQTLCPYPENPENIYAGYLVMGPADSVTWKTDNHS